MEEQLPPGVQAVVLDLRNAQDLLDAHTAIGLARDGVLGTLVGGVSQKLAKLGSIDTRTAARLSTEVAKGPWSAEQQRALGAQILGLTSGTATQAARSPMQTCLKFENYVLPSEHEKIASPTMLRVSKSALVAGRAYSIGLVSPSEPTQLRMVGLVAAGMGYMSMTEQVRKEIKHEITSSLRQMKRRTPYLGLRETTYPDTATELQPGIFEYAYPGSDYHGRPFLFTTRYKQDKGFLTNAEPTPHSRKPRLHPVSRSRREGAHVGI